jgi:hypothetical protein
MPPLRGWILAVLLPFASLAWCGGCWSRFTLPSFRTERERWGTPHFLLFDVLNVVRFARDDNKKRLRLRGIFQKMIVFVCYYNYW